MEEIDSSQPQSPQTNDVHTGSETSDVADASKGSRGEGFTALSSPTRWWYAQTAFPLCAGTFGPMANAFSICALVENWRSNLPPDGTENDGTDIPDPKWLIAVNAVSLACALIANLSLLLNMARRVSFSLAQTITILGFWISSILLIGLIARASYNFKAEGVERQALSQAYYYACWAAGLYQIISYLMCVTVYGALKGKYDRNFKLTTPQRTLMLQTISFLAYLLIGALIFSHVEGWKYLDAVYWADFTLLTVGIGDYAPSTHLGRSLLFPFAVGGIVVLGLVVSSIRSMILDRGKQKFSARMTEKIRRSVVKQVLKLRKGENKLRGRRTGVSRDMVRHIADGPMETPEDELERRETEFEAMRKVQHFSERRQKWIQLTVSVSVWAMLWFFGALVFSYTEKNEQQWSYFVSMYFAYTSLLTIGYGDISPMSNCGKAFFVFWSLLAIPSLTILISDMSDTVVRFVKDATIWIGEVTILPSNDGSVRQSLEYGLSRATWNLHKKVRVRIGKSSPPVPSDAANSDTKSETGQKPVLIKKKSSLHEHEDDTDRLAQNLEQTEMIGEDEAYSRNDIAEADAHHYRRQLISEIRKVYNDLHSDTSKKYTYAEWTHFLKMLGQDERSAEAHSVARLKLDLEQQEKQDENERSKWSWIGPKSPLLSEKHESALLLEMFFEKLEESLHQADPKARKSGDRDRNTNGQNAESYRDGSDDNPPLSSTSTTSPA